MTELNIFESFARHTIYAHNPDLSLRMSLHNRLINACSHAVVVAEHNVGQTSCHYLLLRNMIGTFRTPVARPPYIVQFVVPLHGLRETLMALFCRRTAHRSRNLQHQWLVSLRNYAFGYIDGIHAYRMPGLYITASNESRIVATFHLTVEAYHGYTLLSHTRDGFCDRCSLIGCYYQQVDAAIHQTVYLLHLPFGIIVCTSYYYLGVLFIQMLSSQHLAVYFFAPLARAALRHTYLINLLFRASSQNHHNPYYI